MKAVFIRIQPQWNALLLASLASGGIAIGQEAALGQAVLPPPNAPVPTYLQTEQPSLPGTSNANTALPAADYPPVERLPADQPLASESTIVDAPAMRPDPDLMLLEEPADVAPFWFNYPMVWFGEVPWDSGIEFGVNGATGSNESLSIRAGGYIKRESEFAKIDISTYFNKTSAGGRETQNNAKLDIRNDWLLDASSPWTLFAAGTLFYDKFQAFDLQVNADGGIGYRIIDKDWLDLTGRVGGGASREVGGPQNTWVPEAMLGLAYDQKISANQKLAAKIDYFPELEHLENFRLVTDVGWEIELDQPSNMSLKLSVTDRYDSTPNGNDPQLLNYSVLLLWKM